MWTMWVSSPVVAILTYCKDRKEDKMLWFTVWINLTNMENQIKATETCLSQPAKCSCIATHSWMQESSLKTAVLSYSSILDNLLKV